MRVEAIGTELGMESRTEYRIRDDDPLSASVRTKRTHAAVQDGSRTRTELDVTMRATNASFHLTAVLEAFESDRLVLCREWDEEIPRDLM